MRIKVAEFAGIPIYSDPDCPIGTWFIEDQKTRDLSHKILNLQNELKCHLLTLTSITIDKEASHD